MRLNCYLVDAFTDRLFSGNPAAIVVCPDQIKEDLLLNITMEMKVSETAFLFIRGNGKVLIRWFSEKSEIDLCGHATLASAYILWENGFFEKEDPIEFETKSGALFAKYTNALIELDFPGDYPLEIEPNETIIQALGVCPIYFGKTKTDFFVILESDEQVRKLTPRIDLIASLPSEGLIVSAISSDPTFDFISRVFAPNCGTNEDPVCGIAHCALGPYWGRKLGRDSLSAYQASERGGELFIKIKQDRVLLGGKAKIFLMGTLEV
jgi:PhzF family phenazine biosynthesis protein